MVHFLDDPHAPKKGYSLKEAVAIWAKHIQEKRGQEIKDHHVMHSVNALNYLPEDVRRQAQRALLREMEAQGHIKSASAYLTDDMTSGAAAKGKKKQHPYHGASICKPKHRHTPRTVDDFTTGDWVAVGLVVALSITCLVLLGVFLSQGNQ